MYIIRVDQHNFEYNFFADILDFCAREQINVDGGVLSGWITDESRISYVAYDDDLETVVGFITGHVEQAHTGELHAWVDGLMGKNAGRNLLRKFENSVDGLVKSIHLCTEKSWAFFHRAGFNCKGLHMVKEFNG